MGREELVPDSRNGEADTRYTLSLQMLPDLRFLSNKPLYLRELLKSVKQVYRCILSILYFRSVWGLEMDLPA